MWGRKVKRQIVRRHVSLDLFVTTRNYLEYKVPRDRQKIREEGGPSPKEMSNLGCSVTGLYVLGTWQNANRSSRTPVPQAGCREMN